MDKPPAKLSHSPRIAPELAPYVSRELKPDSPDALEQGCTCNPMRNRFGAGHSMDGEAFYYPENECPLHGLDALSGAIEHSPDKIP